jgi:hypothetical protein
MELTVVLTNLASGGHRGESCARPGAALRVEALELLFGLRPYAGSRAGLTEDRRPHNGGRGDVCCDVAKLPLTNNERKLSTVKFCQPSHEFTFGVGITFIPYPLVLTPLV